MCLVHIAGNCFINSLFLSVNLQLYMPINYRPTNVLQAVMSQKFPLLFNLHNIKQDISVSIVTIPLAGQRNNHRSSPGSIKRFDSSPKHPNRHWTAPNLVYSGYKELLPGIKLPGYEPDPSQSSGEVNAWSYASTPTNLKFVYKESFFSPLKINRVKWSL